MDSKNILCFLACLVLAVSTVTALNCISCSEYIEYNGTTIVAERGGCRNKTEGPGVPCEEGEVCSTIFDPKTNLLTRGCYREDKCKNIEQNCSTCSTDLCGNSGYTINPILAPLLAGLIFAALI